MECRSLSRSLSLALMSAVLRPRSLYNECDQCATAGLVHLTVGRVHLELAGFCKALEAFQRAHKIAHSIQDPSLELQVIRSYCLSVFFSAIINPFFPPDSRLISYSNGLIALSGSRETILFVFFDCFQKTIEIKTRFCNNAHETVPNCISWSTPLFGNLVKYRCRRHD